MSRGLKYVEWLKEYPVTENEPVVRMEAKYVGGLRPCWAMMRRYLPGVLLQPVTGHCAVRFAKPVSPGCGDR